MTKAMFAIVDVYNQLNMTLPLEINECLSHLKKKLGIKFNMCDILLNIGWSYIEM